MKEFNIQGLCNPNLHYMADIRSKLDEIMALVDKGKYFIINRPRQYGKTTTLELLTKRLRSENIVLLLSMERVTPKMYASEKAFIEMLYFNFKTELNLDFLDKMSEIDSFHDFSYFISELVEACDKPVVLLIDEVDKGTNNQVFLDFLSILRANYLERTSSGFPTFKSVILAGVHDVRTLHYQVKGSHKVRENSPWNIAAPFEVDMSFSVLEIQSLLEDFLSEHSNVEMDLEFMAEKIRFYTNGYPFLVSYLCQKMANHLVWTESDLEVAINEILASENTNFESLIKNLANHEDLYNLVIQILLNGREFRYASDAPAIKKGRVYGVLAPGSRGMAKINNPIYEMRIYNYLMERMATERFDVLSDYHTASFYRLPGGALNMELALDKYSEYLEGLYDDSQGAFVEKNARLLLGIFLKTIINGIGFFLPESQIADRLRPDITITYNRYKYLVELKIWRGEAYLEEAKTQLFGYLEREKLDKGYLLVHDFRKGAKRSFTKEEILRDGRVILVHYL